METNPKKWYRKKRYILPSVALATIVGVTSLSGVYQADNANVPETANVVNSFENQPTTLAPKPVVKTTPPPQATDSEINYYTNSSGNTIQSPTHYNSAPAGASAKCGDGSYSFSEHRSGTCSHHGGVSEWL